MNFDKIIKTHIAEDLFGDSFLHITSEYRKLVVQVHPDKLDDKDKEKGAEAFNRVEELYEWAEELVARGDYGKRISINKKISVKITTKSNVYTLSGDKKPGDFCDVFDGTFTKDGISKNVLVKIPRNISDNDLLLNEVKVQKELETYCIDNKLEKVYKGRFPTLLDNCRIKMDGKDRQVAIYEKYDNCYTLEDVMKEYPEGIPMKHVAWIWRRLLICIDLMHRAGYVHGAVLPSNFLIYPETHGGTLISFTASVKKDNPAKVMSEKFEEYYPPEVVAGGKLHSGTDIYMAAMCMLKLMNCSANPLTFTVPVFEEISNKMRGMFRACLLPGYARLRDAFQIHEDLEEILFKMYGKARFHEFKMPK